MQRHRGLSAIAGHKDLAGYSRHGSARSPSQARLQLKVLFSFHSPGVVGEAGEASPVCLPAPVIRRRPLLHYPAADQQGYFGGEQCLGKILWRSLHAAAPNDQQDDDEALHFASSVISLSCFAVLGVLPAYSVIVATLKIAPLNRIRRF